MGNQTTHEALEKKNARLEKKIETLKKIRLGFDKRIVSLEKKNIWLEKQASKKTVAEKMARTLYEIVSAVNATDDLKGLCQAIHTSMDRLMGLSNFYIAVQETGSNRFQIPYFHDQYNDASDHDEFLKRTNALTREVFTLESPVLLNEHQLQERASEGEITGLIPKIWVGLPLKRMKKTMGVMAALHYEDPEYFDQTDLDLLASVCAEIALAVEKKKAFEESGRVRTNLFDIINFMPSVIIGLDHNLFVTHWNCQAELETGIKADSAMGRTLEEVFPRLSLNMLKIKECLQSGSIKTIPRQEYFTGNEKKYEDIIIYPLAASATDGVVIRMDDVTDQVRRGEMLIRSEKMLSIGGLAAGMAHEINNPLAGMMQNAQVIYNRLTQDMPANESAAQEIGLTMASIRAYMEKRAILGKLDMIHNIGKRAAQIVTNMLGFTRQDDSVMEVNDLSMILRQTIRAAKTDPVLKKRYDFKLIHIIEKFDPIPPIKCDRDKIHQVLFNILKNGAEAMFELSNSTFPPQFILRIYQEGTMACVEIEDNGPGMDEEVRKRMFEPFFTTKKVGEGTGLGLSISYFVIVKDHGGEMLVESTPNQNTRFIIKLPYT